jgi:6-phosphogluconolactonase
MIMSKLIKIFPSPYELAESLAHDIVNKITEAGPEKHIFTIAVSGGTTPGILFSVMGDHYSASADWKCVHFFWVDERCVPPSDQESNFRMVKTAFLNKTDIPESNIHRIKGEDDPEREAIRYSKELNESTEKENGFPALDITLLGLGDDGHVASIFPGNEHLFNTDRICLSSVHPTTGQKRITLSGKVINNSRNIFFMVTGSKKALIVNNILSKELSDKLYPASYVDAQSGETFWYIDDDAGSLLQVKTEIE